MKRILYLRIEIAILEIDLFLIYLMKNRLQIDHQEIDQFLVYLMKNRL